MSLARVLVPSVLAGALLLASLGRGLAGPSALRWDRPPPRLEVNPLRDLPEPVALQTLANHLVRMGLQEPLVDEGQGFVRVRVKGENGRYDLYLVPRGRLVHLQIPRLLRVGASDPHRAELSAHLLELNWVNLLGKYSWDPEDGEVRFAHALVTPGGVSFGELSLAVSQSLRTVDLDMPGLERVLRGAGVSAAPGEETPAGPPGGSAGRP